MSVALFLIAGVVCSVLFPFSAAPFYTLVSKIALVLIVATGLSRLASGGPELKRTAQVSIFSATVTFAESTYLGITAHFLLSMPWLVALMVGLAVSTPSPAIVLPLLARFESRVESSPLFLRLRTELISSNLTVIFLFFILLTVARVDQTGAFAAFLATFLIPIVFAFSGRTLKNHGRLLRLLVSLGGILFLLPPLFSNLGVFFGSTLSALLFLVLESYLGGPLEPSTLAVLDSFWKVVRPVLFILMGASLEFDGLAAISIATWGACAFLVLTGVIVRVAYYCYSINQYPAGLFHGDALIGVFASVPKATVQAGIAPVFLSSQFIDQFGSASSNVSYLVLVLAIFLTAAPGSELMKHRFNRLVS